MCQQRQQCQQCQQCQQYQQRQQHQDRALTRSCPGTGLLSPLHAPCSSACRLQPSTPIATLHMLASHAVRKSATLLFLSNAHRHPASVSCRSCPCRHQQPLRGSVAPGRGAERWGREGQQLLQRSSKAKQSPGRILVVTLCLFPLPGLLSGQPPRPTGLLQVPSRQQWPVLPAAGGAVRG